MPKVLYITAFPPNKRTAGQNYSQNLIREWSETSEIDLVVFNYKGHSIELGNSVRILKQISESRISKFLNSLKLLWLHPFFTCRFHISLTHYLKSIAKNYDIIYFDFSQVFIYSIFIKHPRKIFMAHDIIAQKFEREPKFLYRLSISLLRKTECKLLQSSNEIFCFSSKDQSIIKNQYHLKSAVVSFYINSEIRDLDYESLPIADYFVLYGAWNRPENENGLNFFLLKVYPELIDKRIKIIGPGLSEYTKELIKKYENVQYLGFLENPYPVINQAQALIAPIFNGAGVKVKVIESLASGTPIIGTDIAMEGISVKGIEQYISMANNKHEFIVLMQQFNPITKGDKLKIRDNFIKNYNRSKFLHLI